MPARKPRLPDRPKPPRLLCPDGRTASELRRKRGLTQAAFWAQIGVTQSGGRRYESGRPLPAQVAMLLHLAYGTERQAADMIAWLRTPSISDESYPINRDWDQMPEVGLERWPEAEI